MKSLIRIAYWAVPVALVLSTKTFGAMQPLPPLEVVLDHVVKQSEKEPENDRLFAERYAYTRTKTTEEYAPNGTLKRRNEKTSENKPTPAPVALDEQPDLGNSPSSASVRTNIQGRAFEKRDFVLNSDLLNRFDFTLVGRDSINGRPTLMIDFKPKSKDLPVHRFKDRFINKAAGRVWIDETDWFLARADIRLTEKVTVGGGLVGAVCKFHYGFDRDRTPEGLWFTRNVTWYLEGREVFIPKVIQYRERKSEVRRVGENPIATALKSKSRMTDSF